MPTISIDGIDFDLALADGEVQDVSVADRDEFLEAHGDRWDEREPTDAEIIAWAEKHLSDHAQKLIDWPLWSEDDRNGVSARDFYFSTGWAR